MKEMKGYSMKRTAYTIIVVCLACVFLSGCSNKSITEKEGQKSQIEPITEQKNQIEQVEEQLQGTWTCIDDTDVYSKWSFSNGNYVCETYVNGKKIEHPDTGIYTIGPDAILTVNLDNLEGSIPYVFDNGVLTLNGQNGSTLTKD